MNPGAEVFCFVLPVFQDSFILCAFLFPYLKATKHLGIFISLADFGELFSYQGILVDISVQFQDTGFQLVQISTLFFLFCFVLFQELWRNYCLGAFGLYFLCCFMHYILTSLETTLKISAVSSSPALQLKYRLQKVSVKGHPSKYGIPVQVKKSNTKNVL